MLTLIGNILSRRKPVARCIGWLLALLTITPILCAANDDLFELSVEELLNINISTASKFPRSLTQSAGIVSVYSAEEIALFGGRDLSEVLAKITGISPINGTPAGRYRLAMRGDLPSINNNHVLVLLNGVPLNRESYGGGLWLQSIMTAIPLKMLKQIEVIRGPGSVLYGTNAYTGVINLITRSGAELPPSLSLSGGDNDALGADLTLASHSDHHDLAAAFTHYDTDGNPLEANSNGAAFDGQLGQRAQAAMVNTKKGNFHTNVWWGLADDDAIRGSIAGLTDGNVRNEKYFINGGYTNQLSNQWLVKLDLSHVGGRTLLTDPLIPFGEAYYKSDDSRIELQMHGSLNDQLSVVIGTTLDYLSVRVAAPQTFLPFWDNTLYGAYAQLEYLWGRTRFIGGGQFNKSESSGNRTVPRLGVIHNFTNSIGTKLMYAEAFRAPYGLEEGSLVNIPGVFILSGNSELDNETVTTWDAQLFYHTTHLQTSLTWFHSRQKGLITRVLTDPGPPAFNTFINIDKLEIDGLELESKYIPLRNWHFTASISGQKNKSGNGVEDITLNPDIIVKAGVGYRARNWSVGLFDVYKDAYKKPPASSNQQTLNPRSTAHHFITLNAKRTFAALDDVEIGIYVDNLLDEDIWLPTREGFTTSGINTLPALDSGRSFLISATLPLR